MYSKYHILVLCNDDSIFNQLVNLVNLEPSMSIKLVLAVTQLVLQLRMGSFATMEQLLDHWRPICVMMTMFYQEVRIVHAEVTDVGVNACHHVTVKVHT